MTPGTPRSLKIRRPRTKRRTGDPRSAARPRPRHYLEYLVFAAFRGLVRALPFAAARPLGALLGDLARLVDFKHPRIAAANLARALPALSAAERKRIVRRCYRNVGGAICDTLSLARFDAVEICRRLSFEGWELFERAERPGRGVFVLSAHFGSWEVLGPVLSLYKAPVQFVIRPTHNPLVEGDMRRLRERFGSRTILKRRAARGMMKAILDGGRVAVLIDQRVHPHEGVAVPFFGDGSHSTPLLAQLSLRTGAWVVPMFVYPEPGGRFRVVVREPIPPAGEGEEGVRSLTARYMKAIEDEIRGRPEMWLWMHERWRVH